VEIPEDMRHAIARQAEAERERRAKIINAEGEAQAATKLGEAAEIISRNPLAIQLRYLQTLLEIGSERNSTVVFPLPIDLIAPLTQILKGHASGAPAPPTALEAPAPAASQPARRPRRSRRPGSRPCLPAGAVGPARRPSLPEPRAHNRRRGGRGLRVRVSPMPWEAPAELIRKRAPSALPGRAAYGSSAVEISRKARAHFRLR
jgi:hypothetical protein